MVCIGPVVWKHSDADADPVVDDAAIQFDRRGQTLCQLSGESLRVLERVRTSSGNNKLVVANVGNHTAILHAAAEPPGNLCDQPNTLRMTVDLVDLLEPIKVCAQDHDASVACPGDRAFEPFAQHVSFGQTCDAVVVCQVLDPRFQALTFRNVLMRADQAAVWKRSTNNENDSSVGELHNLRHLAVEPRNSVSNEFFSVDVAVVTL